MTRDYTPDGQLGKLVVLGRTYTRDLERATLSGSVSLSRTEISQLDLIVADPTDRYLRSRLFELGGQIDYDDLLLAVAALETATQDGVNVLKVTGRSWRAQRMRKRTGKLVERNTSPTSYMHRRARDAGYKFLGEPSAKRNTVARATGDQPENDWQTGQRLANELGYVAFESGNTYMFGRPTWIMQRAPRVAVDAKTTAGVLGRPVCRRTTDDPRRFATATLEVTTELAARVLPGMRLDLTGVPTFDGAYLIDSVTIPLSDTGVASITASTPTNPEPQGEGTDPTNADPLGALTDTDPGGGGNDRSLGGATALAFTDLALRQAGDAYVFGVNNADSDADPASFDCSELVRWSAARLGVTVPRSSAAQRIYCKTKGTTIPVAEAIRTRGALLFSPGHVAISLGDGRTIEAMNRKYGVRKGKAAGRFNGGARVPGLKYQRHPGPAGDAYNDPV